MMMVTKRMVMIAQVMMMVTLKKARKSSRGRRGKQWMVSVMSCRQEGCSSIR